MFRVLRSLKGSCAGHRVLSAVSIPRLAVSLLGVLSLSMPLAAFSEQALKPIIPEGVRQWVLNQDKQADIREDGWVRLSTGEEFLVVQPAEIPTVTDTVKVVNVTRTDDQPDVVVFDNGYYLLRVVPLGGGEKTLPILENASALLKSAHLPESFHVPDNLYIPNDWKPLLLPDIRFDPNGMPVTQAAYAVDDKTYEFLWIHGRDVTFVPKSATIHTASEAKLSVKEPAVKATTLVPLTPSAAVSAYGTPASGVTVTLPCTPLPQHGLLSLSSVVPGTVRTEYLLTCSDAAEALVVAMIPNPVGGVEVRERITLPAIASDVTFNTPSGLAYFSHADLAQANESEPDKTTYRGWFHFKKQDDPKKVHKFSLISVYSLSKHEMDSSITIPEPIQRIYFSSFRQQLYMLSKKGQSLYVAKTTAPEASLQRLILNAPVKDWAVQYDKLLWLLSEDSKLYAFDMRWQELSTIAELPSTQASLVADSRWVYALMPEQHQIGRYSVADSVDSEKPLVEPIRLSEACSADALWLSPEEDSLYVAQHSCQQLSEVDLGAARELGPVANAIVSNAPQGQFVSLKPMPDEASQLARIRFQDARNLIRSGKLTPPVTLPSGGRGQTEAPTQ
jgi:hypothetical protein